MEEKIELILQYLQNKKQTIATMESCTGGALANAITNIEGSSYVFHFGAVSYSNEYKVKMGVDADTIEKYTVYSIETAHSMANAISKKASADYGIGITGRFGVEDPANPGGNQNIVYISIYDREQDKYIDQTISLGHFEREQCKRTVVQLTIQKLFDHLFQK